MSEKFIYKISRAITSERIEELKEKIFEPKIKTTQYLNDLAKAQNITVLPKFRFLRYQG
jgi:hypothetical protein